MPLIHLPKNAFGPHLGWNLSYRSSVPVLQYFKMAVYDGYPEALSGTVKACLSFGCQVFLLCPLLFSCGLCFLASVGCAGLMSVLRLLLSVLRVSSYSCEGVSACGKDASFDARHLCISSNYCRMPISPMAKRLLCFRMTHKMDAFIDGGIFSLAL